jgi:hypothetical protein
MAEEWHSTQGEVFRFEKDGDSIEGQLVQIRDGNYFRPDGSKSKVFDIKVPSGQTKTIFGTMILERMMGAVKIGQMVKVVSRGVVKTRTGRNAKQFEVFTK